MEYTITTSEISKATSLHIVFKNYSQGWRDESAIKNTDYSPREPGFDLPHPHPAESLLPSDLRLSSGLHGTRHEHGTQIYMERK